MGLTRILYELGFGEPCGCGCPSERHDERGCHGFDSYRVPCSCPSFEARTDPPEDEDED